MPVEFVEESHLLLFDRGLHTERGRAVAARAGPVLQRRKEAVIFVCRRTEFADSPRSSSVEDESNLVARVLELPSPSASH